MNTTKEHVMHVMLKEKKNETYQFLETSLFIEETNMISDKIQNNLT